MAKEILIAGSDKADQEEFQKIFETTHYHLIFSESGEDVLLRVKLFKPDLIITSVGLKGKNGFELCEAIKTDPEYKDVPFILLSNFFEEISEEDRRRVHADGVISKPLHEGEILNLIDRLMEEESMGKREEKMVEKEMEWKSFAEIGKMTPEKTEELSLDQPALVEEEEEIIELVDVVEESEVQMRIDDFTGQEKEEILEEITPLESWGRLEEEEKPSEKEFLLPLGEKEMEIERKPSLPFENEVKPIEAAPEEELFEKIELEEILQKVEQLRPSFEKEWPAGKEEMILEEEPTPIKEVTGKIFGFEEFEAALKGEVKAEPVEDELQPLFLKEPKREVPAEAAAMEVSIEEEELKELPEEEFPEALLEEMLGAEEIRVIEEPKAISLEEVKPEEEIMPEEIRIDRLEEVEAPRIIEEARPLVTMVDKQLQDVILKGVQEMVGDFITRILPEMTQNILGLTVERIEKMVKDIVPDLAEKAIKEEIKRLQKGEKD